MSSQKNPKKLIFAKKFVAFAAAISMALTLPAFAADTSAEQTSVSATDGTLVCKTDFSSGAADGGLTLANKGYFSESYATGIGGKSTEDTSLHFARPASTDSSSTFMGNNIYAYALAPTNKQYIKYEVNIFPNNDDFRSVKFATQGHGSISPTLTCTDSGNDTNAVLERYRWNKVVCIIKNKTIPADTSTIEMSFSVDVFVNGKEVCKNAPYTGVKNNKNPTDDKTPIRFAIYGKDVNKGDGTTDFKVIDTYLDDITVAAYDEYPQIASMPQLIADGEKTAISGNTLTVYETTTVADLKCSDGATLTAFDTVTYDYKMVSDNPLYDGNLIVVSDAANNISYYTVKKDLRNDAQITGNNGKVTANANLKNAVLFLAGYDEDGNMIRADYSAVNGKTSVTLDGEFAVAKAMVIGAGLKPMCEAKTYVARPSIACWGDSITYSQGCSDVSKTSYPAVLGQISGLESHNMGVGGETNTSIASRQGGYTIKLDEAFTIPKERTAVEIKFSAYDKDGKYAGVVTPRNASLGGWNPCVINGVEGTLTIDVNSKVWPRVLNRATFTRAAAGEAVSVAKGDRLIVAANNLKADINIVNASSNGGWGPANKTANDNDSADLINTLDSMIANFKYPDKFIIIGVTTGGTGAWAKTDAALKAKYGEHFLDIKAYLTDKTVLTENGVVLTDKDNEYLAKGKVPPSLLNNSPTDDTHLNDVGYRLFAQRVYEKMQELGYAK